jgi:class 3 adenylate cyclase
MAFSLKSFLKIKNSFLSVLVLFQVLIVVLAILFTRIALRIIDSDEAQKRDNVARFVTNSVNQTSSSAVNAVLPITANAHYMELFEKQDRDGLLAATSDLFSSLQQHEIKQFQFNLADFKVFLRVHNPAVFGEDFTTSRPTLVECITEKKLVYGLEQGRSGYGFRAVAPAYFGGKLIGCVELGSDLNTQFLQSMDANYPGKWTVVNLEKSMSFVHDVPVLDTLNEPKDSEVFSKNFTTPDNIVRAMKDSRLYYEYNRKTEEMSLYIPIKNFKGSVALYVRYVCQTPYYSIVRSIVLNAVAISLLSMVLSSLIFFMLYREIKNPVLKLVAETDKIKNFDLAEKVEIPASLAELEILIKAVGDMKMGLQSFQKYVPANLVRQLIETHQEARIGGKLKELTVFFSDVADFTHITENLAPNELTTQLSEYFDDVTNAILEFKGTVDKYIGDSVMAFWGAPYEMEDHALMACRAALKCQRQIQELGKRWKAEGKYEFQTRIGLSTGEIVVGNVGSEQRLNYTVIGDPVNLASRLEGLNKHYGTRIIVSEETYNHCRKFIEVRLLDFVIVKGKSEPVRIYELVGEKGDISPKQKECIVLFSTGLDFYLQRDWGKAIKVFSTLREKNPDDFPTRLYLDRCEQFKSNPPHPDWKGECEFKTK